MSRHFSAASLSTHNSWYSASNDQLAAWQPKQIFSQLGKLWPATVLRSQVVLLLHNYNCQISRYLNICRRYSSIMTANCHSVDILLLERMRRRGSGRRGSVLQCFKMFKLHLCLYLESWGCGFILLGFIAVEAVLCERQKDEAVVMCVSCVESVLCWSWAVLCWSCVVLKLGCAESMFCRSCFVLKLCCVEAMLY